MIKKMQKIFFILLGLFGLSELLENFSWKKVHFSKTYLANKVALKSEILNSIFHCGLACSRTTDCTFWCYQPDRTCSLYDLVVSPTYRTTDNDTVVCGTEKRNDIVTYASITSIGSINNVGHHRNLIGGVKSIGYCSINSDRHPWILLDLQRSALISDVIIHPTEKNSAGTYCQYIQVRISSTPLQGAPGNFSPFKLVSSLDRKCQPRSIEHLRLNPPQIGRYLSIQKMTLGMFCIRHLEIDGVFLD